MDQDHDGKQENIWEPEHRSSPLQSCEFWSCYDMVAGTTGKSRSAAEGKKQSRPFANFVSDHSEKQVTTQSDVTRKGMAFLALHYYKPYVLGIATKATNDQVPDFETSKNFRRFCFCFEESGNWIE